MFPPELADVAEAQLQAGVYPQPLGPSFSEMAGRDFRALLAGFPGPALILNGEKDSASRRGEAGFVAAARQGGRKPSRARATRATSTSQPCSIKQCASSRNPSAGHHPYLRHPIYAATWLMALAPVVLLPNWIAGWSTLATFLPICLTRVPREEQMMLDHFGEAYRSYMNRTGRVIPRFQV